MADTGSGISSFFAGDKRIPSTSFYGYLFSGVAVDVLAFWLPGAGDVFIVYCRGMYWLNGYKTDKMGMATFVDMAVEAIPVLEALPCATAFVIWSYAINVAETKAGEELTAQVTRSANEYVAARNVGNALKGFGGGNAAAPGASGAAAPSASSGRNQNTAHEEKKPQGNVSSAPLSNADKNISYGQNKSVDGIERNDRAPLPKAANDNVGYKNTGTPEPAGIKNPGDQNTGYRERA